MIFSVSCFNLEQCSKNPSHVCQCLAAKRVLTIITSPVVQVAPLRTKHNQICLKILLVPRTLHTSSHL
jgi:hypothetical protein